MTTFIPKMARKILASSEKQRDFFLKPYGLDVLPRLPSSQRTAASLESIRNTNSSSIRSSCIGPAKKSTSTCLPSKQTRSSPSQRSSNTYRSCITSTSRR